MPSKPVCVIKQFFYQGNNVEKAEELFRQEAVQLEALGKQHSQIPELMAHFELGSELYLVEEFIEGKDLLEELKEQGTFEETKINQLLNNLLPVLQFIHNNRIIHRDIKPENIIRCQVDDKLVLVDFGVSKFATETALGKTGTVIGTPGYAAPEQNQGKAYFSSDLYSLGATCFYLLTETHPSKVFSQWCDWQKYLRIHLSKNDISDELKLILSKLLNPDINERYHSAEEVLQDLKFKPTQASMESSLVIPTSAPKPCTKSSKCVHTLTGHAYYVCTVAINADRQTIASGATDHLIKIWNLQTGKLLHTIQKHSGDVNCLAFSPDGKKLVSASWASSRNPKKNPIYLWDLSSREELRTFSEHFGSVLSVAISPDGNNLVSGGADRTIKLWNLHTGELLSTLSDHSTSVLSVVISPDGQLLASGSSDNTIKLWNLHTGELLNTLSDHSEPIYSVAISPNGQILVSASEDMTIKLWNLPSGKLLNTLFGHSGSVNSISISSDSQILASGSSDKTINIWDLTTGELLDTLTEHSQTVFSVSFSPNGQILASGSQDSTIKIWQLSE